MLDPGGGFPTWSKGVKEIAVRVDEQARPRVSAVGGVEADKDGGVLA